MKIDWMATVLIIVGAIVGLIVGAIIVPEVVQVSNTSIGEIVLLAVGGVVGAFVSAYMGQRSA